MFPWLATFPCYPRPSHPKPQNPTTNLVHLHSMARQTLNFMAPNSRAPQILNFKAPSSMAPQILNFMARNCLGSHSVSSGWARIAAPRVCHNERGEHCNRIESFRGGPVVRRTRIGVVRAGTSVLTASRVEGGSGLVRVMGPGNADVKGIGRLLVFDEFFEFPNTTGLPLRDPDVLLESVIYYCDAPSPASSELEEFEGFQPRHGVHLYLTSSMRSMTQGASSRSDDSCVVETGGSLVVPVIDHVRDASSIVPTTVHDGAAVRVIAGSFGDVSIGPPLQDFVMLDVQMRPASEMSLPLDPSFAVMIYILEGVGIFEPNRFEEDEAPFYENEGHGLYIPPSQKQARTTIRTHEWSQLRFILIGAPII